MKVKIQNFHQGELACPCCGAQKITVEALTRLQCLRDLLGFALPVASGFRCHNHNKVIGGASSSKHLLGLAFDIKTTRMSAARKHKLLKIGGQLFSGVGVYDKHIHLDSRKSPAFGWEGQSSHNTLPNNT